MQMNSRKRETTSKDQAGSSERISAIQIDFVLTIVLRLLFGIIFVFFASASFGVEFIDIENSGDGCEQGSVRATISPDGKQLSLIYDHFIAGPRNPARCRSKIKLLIAEDEILSLVNGDFRGWVALDSGARALQVIRYRLNKVASEREVVQTEFFGPIDDGFTASAEIKARDREWSRCRERVLALIINTQLFVKAKMTPGASDGSNVISMDSMDSKIVQNFGVETKKCQSKKKNGSCICKLSVK
jgi:Domain of unknown function (DUF4360)